MSENTRDIHRWKSANVGIFVGEQVVINQDDNRIMKLILCDMMCVQ